MKPYDAEVFAGRQDRLRVARNSAIEAGWQNGGKRILEIGTGAGEAAEFLAEEYGLDLTAADCKQERIKKAKSQKEKMKKGTLCFCCADVCALPFADNSFDGVYSEVAFSVVKDKPKACSELHRVLRPGGIAVVNDLVVFAGEGKTCIAERVYFPCFKGVQTPECYTSLFEASGFSTKESKEGFDELIRIATCLHSVYGTEPEDIGYYLSRYYGAGTYECLGKEGCPFYDMYRMSYWHLIFQKN